jgi:hypothetical protein
MFTVDLKLGYDTVSSIEIVLTFLKNIASACCLLQAGFLLGLFFDPKDGGET